MKKITLFTQKLKCEGFYFNVFCEIQHMRGTYLEALKTLKSEY